MMLKKLECIFMSEIVSKAAELGEFLECSVVDEEGSLLLKYRQMAIRAIRRERLEAEAAAREAAEHVPAEHVNAAENTAFSEGIESPFSDIELTPRQKRRAKGKAKARPVEAAMETEETEIEVLVESESAGA